MIYIYFADKRKRMIVFEIVRVRIHMQKEIHRNLLFLLRFLKIRFTD